MEGSWKIKLLPAPIKALKVALLEVWSFCAQTMTDRFAFLLQLNWLLACINGLELCVPWRFLLDKLYKQSPNYSSLAISSLCSIFWAFWAIALLIPWVAQRSEALVTLPVKWHASACVCSTKPYCYDILGWFQAWSWRRAIRQFRQAEESEYAPGQIGACFVSKCTAFWSNFWFTFRKGLVVYCYADRAGGKQALDFTSRWDLVRGLKYTTPPLLSPNILVSLSKMGTFVSANSW